MPTQYFSGKSTPSTTTQVVNGIPTIIVPSQTEIQEMDSVSVTTQGTASTVSIEIFKTTDTEFIGPQIPIVESLEPNNLTEAYQKINPTRFVR